MRHNTTQTLFRYFNRIRDGRPAPLRSDINPSELKGILPDVFILELERSGAIRFRLAGTRVCSILGRELRGETFDLLWCRTDRHKMKLAAEAVLANQNPLVIPLRALSEDGETHALEMLLLPLSSQPGVADRLFGSLVGMEHVFYREGEYRLLKADGLDFVASDSPSRTFATRAANDAPAVSAHAVSPRNKLVQLRLLQGGRRD